MNFPSKCPHCGKDIQPNPIKHIWEKENFLTDAPLEGITLELHRCIHCKENFFIAKEECRAGNVIKNSKIVFSYPISKFIDLPNNIKKLSPTAYETYKDTINAKGLNLNTLVGAGLRISLEHLIWDYLIKLKGFSEAELKNLSLCKRLQKIQNDEYKSVCSHIIRKFGNDSVHIIKQIDFSTDEVFDLFRILCNLISAEMIVKEANERCPKLF